MFKKTIYLIIILFNHLLLFAGGNKLGEKAVSEPSNNAALSFNDSVYLFPAYTLYSQWDTSTIHPYKYDLSEIEDSAHIQLQDGNYNCGYITPVCGEITSEFGYRHGKPHYGIDINLETGDTVVAAFEGMVRIAKFNKTFGNVVIIRHSNGLETFYAHLSKILVSSGQVLEPGKPLGLGGNTGHSYGSHLHFEVRYKGMPINPEEMISFMDNKVKQDTFCITKSCFTINKHHSKSAKNSGKKTKFHVVKKGETLYRIAKIHGTTPEKLCKLNKIKISTKLSIGKKIRYS